MENYDMKQILENAIRNEEQSYSLYKMAQGKVKYESSKKFLEELAQEELMHQEKLKAILEDKKQIAELGFKVKKIQDLKITDTMKTVTISEDADYQKILIFAAKREKSTYDYYKSLALGLENTEAGNLFQKLAEEELTHKNKLEREYDDYILREN
jgi:rubrerythrin